MIASKDLSKRRLTFTAEELVDARVAFVEGVIYAVDLGSVTLVTPVCTGEWYVCDCRVIKRHGGGFEYDKRHPHPAPIKLEYLGEPIAVIL